MAKDAAALALREEPERFGESSGWWKDGTLGEYVRLDPKQFVVEKVRSSYKQTYLF